MTFPALQYFSPREFHHPDLMDANFLVWLDAVRSAAGVPFTLTSDARTPAENAAASGSSPASLHLLGRAVDFVPQPWSRETLWHVVAAVTRLAGERSVELELVSGPTDHHIHLGLFPDKRPSRLVLTLD